MTKEEIVKQFIASYEPDTFIKNEHGTLMYYSQNGVSGINLECFFEDLVEHVLDQQTSELKAELVKATETAKVTSVTQRQHIERLQNELNELKERHKKDVIGFADFICLKGYTLIQENISQNSAMFFLNKNSIGVSSIELYEQYKQKFESNGK